LILNQLNAWLKKAHVKHIKNEWLHYNILIELIVSLTCPW